MEINYSFRKTSRIEKDIIRIEVAKKLIELLPTTPQVEEFFRRSSLLKSSLFSAKIEGNRLKIEEIQSIEKTSPKNKEKKEIFNILQALKWIHSRQSPKRINSDLISKLHKRVMQELSPGAGKLRSEPSAIFNQSGIAVYMTPPPSKLSSLINQLITITKNRKHPAIIAGIVHFAFEKIHPFLDGNGRVGRLLASLVLKNSGYGFRGLVALEEYISDNREEYYDLLASENKDITNFIEFFLEAVATSAEKAIEQLQVSKEDSSSTLLPRRQEILAIIQDHKMTSFNFIKRRFSRVPDSSLHYDLKMLINKGFIKKLGTTRGVLYSPK